MEKVTNNGPIFYVHGQEELIVLKCLYYIKKFTDSMQALLKYQKHFHKARINNARICKET